MPLWPRTSRHNVGSPWLFIPVLVSGTTGGFLTCYLQTTSSCRCKRKRWLVWWNVPAFASLIMLLTPHLYAQARHVRTTLTTGYPERGRSLSLLPGLLILLLPAQEKQTTGPSHRYYLNHQLVDGQEQEVGSSPHSILAFDQRAEYSNTHLVRLVVVKWQAEM